MTASTYSYLEIARQVYSEFMSYAPDKFNNLQDPYWEDVSLAYAATLDTDGDNRITKTEFVDGRKKEKLNLMALWKAGQGTPSEILKRAAALNGQVDALRSRWETNAQTRTGQIQTDSLALNPFLLGAYVSMPHDQFYGEIPFELRFQLLSSQSELSDGQLTSAEADALGVDLEEYRDLEEADGLDPEKLEELAHDIAANKRQADPNFDGASIKETATKIAEFEGGRGPCSPGQEAALAYISTQLSAFTQLKKPFTGDDRQLTFYMPYAIASNTDPLCKEKTTSSLTPRQALSLGAGKAMATNVVAYFPASNGFTAEPIVFEAHVDHLAKDGEGNVYPGADDNASGVAVLLALAKKINDDIASRKLILQRPIMLSFSTEEEQGMHGSKAIMKAAKDGTWPKGVPSPLNRGVVISVDMVGRGPTVGETPKLYLAGSKTLSPEFHNLIEELNRGMGIGLDPRAYSADDDILQEANSDYLAYRSDHVVAEAEGLLSLFLFGGFHEDYHQPTDTADKLEPEQLAASARFAMGLALGLANSNALPTVDQKRFQDFQRKLRAYEKQQSIFGTGKHRELRAMADAKMETWKALEKDETGEGNLTPEARRKLVQAELDYTQAQLEWIKVAKPYKKAALQYYYHRSRGALLNLTDPKLHDESLATLQEDRKALANGAIAALNTEAVELAKRERELIARLK